MARRIDVELTSSREDGSWTWRAAGARQPKGDMPGSLVYDGAVVGDVCKVEAEFHVDGIEITEVFPPKKKKDRSAEFLEMKSRPLRDDELVTEVRAPKGRGGRDGGRGGRGGRDGGRGGRDGGRGGRDGGRSGSGQRRPREDDRPKAKRLRPRREHRNAVLAEVPEEHRPIAEQVLQGGMPAVRSAIEKQNEEAKAEGKPEISADPIIAIAEPLVPVMRAAEWRDRADAAMADIAELDLRDLRSVVVASDAARDDEARALAEQLRTSLTERIETDHAQWLKDVQSAVDDGRTVRALRLSSRPVKAGAPLPTELANRLSAAASTALAADVLPDRWATVVDALAYTPIRSAVTPAGYPAEPTEELLEAVRRVADRVPTIAAHFGIDPSEAAKAKKRRRPNRGGKKPKAAGKPADEKRPKSDATSETPKAGDEATPAEAASEETDVPTTEAPAAEEAAPPEQSAPEQAASEAEPQPEEAAAAEPEEAVAAEDAAPADEG